MRSGSVYHQGERRKVATKKVKAVKLEVTLPFGLGKLEFEPDEVQQRAAWELYVELTTRIAVQPLGPDQGFLQEALSSLHTIFGATREILRKAGPSVASGPNSFGPVAIEVLNQGIRPFLAKWHPLLLSFEQKRPKDVSEGEYEREWELGPDLRRELASLQQQLSIYASALAQIAGIRGHT